jgi:hypothetical protein
MYKILGADGNQYGPVSAEQVRAWVVEGRANAETMAQLEGATEWRALSTFPEFADTVAGRSGRPVPPLTSAVPVMTANVEQLVHGPATGLIVVGVIGFVLSVAGLVANLTGAVVNLPGMDHNTEMLTRTLSGTFGIISTIVSLLLSGIIFWGGTQMKVLRNYPLAMAASILSIIPCLSPCCLLGLPLGIWAAIVLGKPEVKAAFH